MHFFCHSLFFNFSDRPVCGALFIILKTMQAPHPDGPLRNKSEGTRIFYFHPLQKYRVRSFSGFCSPWKIIPASCLYVGVTAGRKEGGEVGEGSDANLKNNLLSSLNLFVKTNIKTTFRWTTEFLTNKRELMSVQEDPTQLCCLNFLIFRQNLTRYIHQKKITERQESRVIKSLFFSPCKAGNSCYFIENLHR